MSPIIDLQRRLVEVGRIRMGKKQGNRPVKLDTWRITSRDQERLSAVADLYGGKVEAWADREGEFEVVTTVDSLPILLIPGQALSQWYETWSAGGCQRRCDGTTEVLSDGPCLCGQEDGDRTCKPTTRLSVMLPDVPGLGCYRLESHGYYAAVELSATAGMLEEATARGQLLPARLRIDQRRQVKAGQTTRYAVPVVDIDITMREALPLANGRPDDVEQLAYTPARRSRQAITVGDGLKAAGEDAKVTSGRAAAPIREAGDLEFGEPVPVEDSAPGSVRAESGAPGAEPSELPASLPPAAGADKPSAAQVKKLNVLVGKLRDERERISTGQLWSSVAKSRNIEVADMVDVLQGRDGEGVLHWSPLRDSLTKVEASALIEKLTAVEAEA